MSALAHDAQNLVAALSLYCDLLAQPGVLSPPYRHFAQELRTVVRSCSALVARLAMQPDPQPESSSAKSRVAILEPEGRAGLAPPLPYIDDFADAVQELAGPLALVVGPRVALEVECLPCPGRVRLSRHSLARILFNLSRNAAEAMPQGGHIRIIVQQGGGGNFLEGADRNPLRQTALLCVQDSGPGIPSAMMEHLFEPGYSTKPASLGNGRQRGLGLSSVRDLAESAGGCVRAVSAPGRGARFEVELPMVHRKAARSGFPADFAKGRG